MMVSDSNDSIMIGVKRTMPDRVKDAMSTQDTAPAAPAKHIPRDPETVPYGFLTEADLPDTDIYEDILLPVSGIRFATTGDFAAVARNHCGAVCASNVLLCLGGGRSSDSIFSVMHKMIGNGPVFSLNRGIKKGARVLGSVIFSERASSRRDIISAIDRGMPAALLLSNSLFDWHWVLCVGYRRYPVSVGGNIYLRLVNSWQDSPDTFYLPGKGSRILSGRAFSALFE